jgi:hypothetical protein
MLAQLIGQGGVGMLLGNAKYALGLAILQSAFLLDVNHHPSINSNCHAACLSQLRKPSSRLKE